MPVTDTHPQYDENYQDWIAVTHSLKETRVRKQRTVYLPKTSGQIAFERMHPDLQSPYERYIEQAFFPTLTSSAIISLNGVAHRKSPEYLVPARMEPFLQNITSEGDSIDDLSPKIGRKLLAHGRAGILTDVDDMGQPYFSLYDATAIINWKQTIIGGRKYNSLIVLEEQRADIEADEFSHKTQKQYRILRLRDGVYTYEILDQDENVIQEETQFSKASQKPMDTIPFVFPGAIDQTPDVDESPMLPLARIAYTIYKVTADYYQSLHNTAQATAYTTGAGEEPPNLIGSGAIWHLPEGATAGFLEVVGNGISKHDAEIANLYTRAQKFSGELAEKIAGGESGEALKTRLFSSHASLMSVAINTGAAIESSMRYAADMLALDPELVMYKPNLDFTSQDVSEALINAINSAINAGNAPRSVMFEVLRRNKLTELDDDELEEEISNFSDNLLPRTEPDQEEPEGELEEEQDE